MDSGEAWVAVTIDEIERIDWPRSGISWRPVRRALGTDIIGIAAFTSERPDDVVVEPHTEVDDGRGQQEVYVVMRGKAQFVIDGAEVEAPAGTLLRVDAHAHRQATAIDGDTVILALGGESTFDPSPSEWIERARPHIRSDPSRARAIIEDLRRERPHDRAVDVGEALLAVGQDDETKARAIVAELLADRPQLRQVLEHDPDLRPLLLD